MKDRFESSEVFTAYATIEAGYYMIEELNKQLGKDKPRSNIAAMIDDVTGYGAARNKGYIEDAVCILTDIIEAKKVIEADSSKDEELLSKIKGISN